MSLSFLDYCFFFSSRRRHTRCSRDWSSDVCSSDLFFVGLLAADAVFLGRRQRNVVLEMAHASSVLGVDLERVLIAIEVHLLPLGVDFMFAVSTIPLGDGRVLVHVLDDLAPADAGVVRAEGDFALLRG